MSEEEINQQIQKLLGLDHIYGLQKHGLWWRERYSGYTSNEMYAGRYTLAEAKSRECVHGQEDDVTVHQFKPRPYTQSLDACAEMEATLKGDMQKRLYANIVFQETKPGQFSIMAPPMTRCVSFLKTHGIEVAS